jgi:hypothetical protein
MSLKASPLLGYNNNVRHRGKVFHIQTEDSGVRYGHIITHLFMDGGRILKSVKTSYSEYAESDRRPEIVREMMKQQHKAMFIALRDGKFDAIVDGSAQASHTTRAVAAEAPPKVSAPATSARPTEGAVTSARPTEGAVTSARPTEGAVPKSPPANPSSRAAPDLAVAARERAAAVALDVDVLERAAHAASEASAVLRPMSDLPPPPANLLRAKTAEGAYRVAPASKAESTTARAAKSAAPSNSAPAERRYAPTRPSSTFGQARPQQGKTIFGEDPVSDKSLDEVILSYLSAELDEKK